MKNILAILISLFLFGCGREKDDEQDTNDDITGEQVQELTVLRSQTYPWAVTCQDGQRTYACEDRSDGDSMIWMGALCTSGETQQCANVKASQGANGRLWRSPARVDNDTSNSFSKDMLLGYLGYLTVTKDVTSAQKFITYLYDNDFQLCDDASDSRCDVNPTQYRAIWGLMKRIWENMGLEPTKEMKQGDFGDDTIINLQSQFTPGGFTLHLVALEIYLRNKLNSNTGTIQSAANTIAERQYENPFFEYVARGRTQRSAALTLQHCPRERPADAYQWAWQRDQREQAWVNSMGWDCIFMSNLLIGDRG